MIFMMQDAAEVEEGARGLTSFFADTPWIDLLGITVVAIFFVLGIRRGLVWQVTRLIGMLLAITLARSISPELVPRFEDILHLPAKASQGIVWFLVFVGTLIVTSLIGLVGRRALEAVQLGPMDRMGGGMAGAATGTLVHCVILILMTSLGTPQWTADTLKGSASASVLDNLSRKKHLLLNAQAAERIVGPWGLQHDAHCEEEQLLRFQKQQRESRERADELRRMAEEEEQKMRAKDSPGLR